jgi:Subtilase family
MVPDKGLCLMFGNLKTDIIGPLNDAAVVAAVQWAAFEQKAHVIYVNVATIIDYNPMFDGLLNLIYSQGSIVVAPAGSAGNMSLAYPASFSSVLSVGFIDSNRMRYVTSNYNSGVDLVGPGAAIQSTSVLKRGNKGYLKIPGAGIEFNLANYNNSLVYQSISASGIMVDCGIGKEKCPGSGGHICLVTRYVKYLYQTI